MGIQLSPDPPGLEITAPRLSVRELPGTGRPEPDWAFVSVLRQGGDTAVSAVLESYGDLLHEYIRLMLGDQIATMTVLTNTVVTVLAHSQHVRDARRVRTWLFTVARVKVHEYYPAGWDEAGERYLASVQSGRRSPAGYDRARRVITDSALLRMWPDDRETFILSSPAYHLATADLAVLLGQPGEEARAAQARAWASFRRMFTRSAKEAGFGKPPSEAAEEAMYEQASESLGRASAQSALDHVAWLCTNPVLAGIHGGVRSAIGALDPDGFPVTTGLVWPASAQSRTPKQRFTRNRDLRGR